MMKINLFLKNIFLFLQLVTLTVGVILIKLFIIDPLLKENLTKENGEIKNRIKKEKKKIKKEIIDLKKEHEKALKDKKNRNKKAEKYFGEI